MVKQKQIDKARAKIATAVVSAAEAINEVAKEKVVIAKILKLDKAMEEFMRVTDSVNLKEAYAVKGE